MTVVKNSLNPDDVVPLREGPPTKEELLAHYSAKFTWTQLKTFINSGDLGLLKRDKKLQARYIKFNDEVIKPKFGSISNYLLNHRLQWGKPDTLSLLSPDYAPNIDFHYGNNHDNVLSMKGTPPLPPDAPRFFTADISPEYLSVIRNDWPYSVPSEVEHSLIWSRVPFFCLDIIPDSVRERIGYYGLWGFTGSVEPPPSPSSLPDCIGALSEWGVTLDKLKIPPTCNSEEEALLEQIGSEVEIFVISKWRDDEWETTWFINPPELSHIHVFARRRSH
ncbi:hypothetical protein F5887DRAFT_946476 [Amanita rubescens]|nr:hypothetical protein F5887DRAFT_946476 [Amanita rubescens]